MQETWKPTVGGILAIFGGAIEMIFGIVVAAVGSIGWFFGMPWFSAIGAPLIMKDLGTGACRVYLCTCWSLGSSRDTLYYIRQLGEARI